MTTMDRPAGSQRPRSSRSSPGERRLWTVLTAVEAVAAAVTIVLDLLVPTLVLLAMAASSLLARREGLASLGLHRMHRGLVWKMLAFAAAWTVFQVGVTKPIANHVSGQTQDLSSFENLEGNLGVLAVYLFLGWTLAALGEELAYRGYLFTRVRQVLGGGRAALVVAVAVSSLLFGLAHMEQGVIGVLVVTLDALAWSGLRLHYKTLWASILAHGFNNTLGFITFFLVGPVHGLW